MLLRIQSEVEFAEQAVQADELAVGECPVIAGGGGQGGDDVGGEGVEHGSDAAQPQSGFPVAVLPGDGFKHVAQVGVEVSVGFENIHRHMAGLGSLSVARSGFREEAAQHVSFLLRGEWLKFE